MILYLQKIIGEAFNQRFECDSTPAYDLLASVAILQPSYLGNVDKCHWLTIFKK